ncbi:MAG: nickel-responsive transcriptional regulator NikR [Thermoprotei archaeon]|nr:MAG: nickel-responsive transcriptional regulator NikR [Thermoprotei archaeon]
MVKTVKTGVSLPADLVSELDKIVDELNLPSRSYALRRAVMDFISEREWIKGEKGILAGAISILYDHAVHEISDRLIEIQHNFLDIIKSTVHVHIDERRCLEVILVHGRTERIKELAKSIESQKGLIFIKYTFAKV